MLSALPLWILLNTYAFLLDALSIAGGAGAWWLFSYGHPVYAAVVGAAAAALLFAAIRVHLSYPAKLKAYHVLYQRNREVLHRNSFYDFMGSPCYRLVVRTVLYRTGHPEEYQVIFKEIWGSGLPFLSRKPATVVFFDNPDDGARWLQSHRSLIDGHIAAEDPSAGKPQ